MVNVIAATMPDIKFCESCNRLNIKSRLRLYQLNLDEAVWMCDNEQCFYPLSALSQSTSSGECFVVKRSVMQAPRMQRNRLPPGGLSVPTSSALRVAEWLKTVTSQPPPSGATSPVSDLNSTGVSVVSSDGRSSDGTEFKSILSPTDKDLMRYSTAALQTPGFVREGYVEDTVRNSTPVLPPVITSPVHGANYNISAFHVYASPPEHLSKEASLSDSAAKKQRDAILHTPDFLGGVCLTDPESVSIPSVSNGLDCSLSAQQANSNFLVKSVLALDNLVGSSNGLFEQAQQNNGTSVDKGVKHLEPNGVTSPSGRNQQLMASNLQLRFVKTPLHLQWFSASRDSWLTALLNFVVHNRVIRSCVETISDDFIVKTLIKAYDQMHCLVNSETINTDESCLSTARVESLAKMLSTATRKAREAFLVRTSHKAIIEESFEKLVESHGSLEEQLVQTSKWQMVCRKCCYKMSNRYQNVVQKIPGVLRPFTNQQPAFACFCIKCGTSDQLMNIHFVGSVRCILMSLEAGMSSSNIAAYNCRVAGRMYSIGGVVVRKEQGYASWVKTATGWLLCDGMKPAAVHHGEPAFVPSDASLLIWQPDEDYSAESASRNNLYGSGQCVNDSRTVLSDQPGTSHCTVLRSSLPKAPDSLYDEAYESCSEESLLCTKSDARPRANSARTKTTLSSSHQTAQRVPNSVHYKPDNNGLMSAVNGVIEGSKNANLLSSTSECVLRKTKTTRQPKPYTSVNGDSGTQKPARRPSPATLLRHIKILRMSGRQKPFGSSTPSNVRTPTSGSVSESVSRDGMTIEHNMNRDDKRSSSSNYDKPHKRSRTQSSVSDVRKSSCHSDQIAEDVPRIRVSELIQKLRVDKMSALDDVSQRGSTVAELSSYDESDEKKYLALLKERVKSTTQPSVSKSFEGYTIKPDVVKARSSTYIGKKRGRRRKARHKKAKPVADAAASDTDMSKYDDTSTSYVSSATPVSLISGRSSAASLNSRSVTPPLISTRAFDDSCSSSYYTCNTVCNRTADTGSLLHENNNSAQTVGECAQLDELFKDLMEMTGGVDVSTHYSNQDEVADKSTPGEVCCDGYDIAGLDTSEGSHANFEATLDAILDKTGFS